MSASRDERIYREYMSFFDQAERTRRWSVMNDLPWDKAASAPADENLVLCAETFCGVEMYLPDYVSQGINLMRESFGQAWFAANWGYEESKHSIALREYLLRTGKRTHEQLAAFEREIFGRRWNLPFSTPRQMTIYGAVQELTTYVIYKKQRAAAEAQGDELLSSIYGFLARDEIAHFSFYKDVTRVLLEEDPEGTKVDLVHVLRHFRMPAHDLIADYDRRADAVRPAGVDRKVFVLEVWLPLLKALGLTRHDLPTGDIGLARASGA